MMLGPDDCPVVSASGQVRGARCGKQLSGVCVAKHCAGRGRGRGRGCCKMTREEAWQWERRVQGRSIVLRPHTPHVKVCFKNIFLRVSKYFCAQVAPAVSPAGPAGPVRGTLVWVVACVVWGAAVLCLIGVRLLARHNTERRYQAYNASREKY